MRWVFGAACALVACGGRTELAGSSRDDAGPLTPTVVTCHPGDPPMVLADGLTTTEHYDEIATDGTSVYVSQNAKTGTLWRISADDGARSVLRQVSLGGFGHLTPGDDGVYTDLTSIGADGGDGLVEGYWTRADGLAQRVMMHWGVFAPPLLYWRDFSETNGTTVSVTSMTEGWTHPLLYTQAFEPTDPIAVTERYLYVSQRLYDDCATARIDLTDGSVQWLSSILNECLTPAVSGPNAVCSWASCVLDEDDTMHGAHGTLALDATYAYRVMGDQTLHRVALRADQDDLVTTLAPLAVAVSNGCVYVKTKTQLVRVAAP